MNPAQIAALRQVARAVIEVCAAEPCGAPGGVIYAALMTQGASLNQYEGVMSGLTRAGLLVRDDDCYTATAKGRAFAGVAA